MLNNLSKDLQSYTDQLTQEHNIPAISLALWQNGQMHQAASGILNLDTGVEATTDSIFQIGSITKVFTTSLIMKLVEQGRIDLAKPVKHYLREFQLADAKAAEIITVKHLLNHTNGIAGDYFPDDQHEDGPHIARLVYRSSQLPLVHPVGDGFSYSNVAFAVAGRLIEVVSGMTWFDAMEEWIFQPLGMRRAICRPEDVIRFRAALGHLVDPNDPSRVYTCSGKYLSLGQAPAGTTPTMTAADLITFGRAHLEGGLTQTGERWLSKESVRQMQTATAQVPITTPVLTGGIGLGWGLSRHNHSGLQMVGHTGGTNGACALLRLFPEHNACFAVLMNRQKLDVLMAIGITLTETLTGTDITTAPSPAQVPTPLSREALTAYAGNYQAYAGDYHFRVGEEGLQCSFSDAVDEEDDQLLHARALGDECFELLDTQGTSCGVVRFMNPNEQGEPMRLFAAGRLYRRV